MPSRLAWRTAAQVPPGLSSGWPSQGDEALSQAQENLIGRLVRPPAGLRERHVPDFGGLCQQLIELGTVIRPDPLLAVAGGGQHHNELATEVKDGAGEELVRAPGQAGDAGQRAAVRGLLTGQHVAQGGIDQDLCCGCQVHVPCYPDTRHDSSGVVSLVAG